MVRILSTLDRELLKPSSSVALHRHSNALVDILPPEADSSIAMLGADEKPDVKYSDVGGLDQQKQEIREAVELPLVQVTSPVDACSIKLMGRWICTGRLGLILLEVFCFMDLRVSCRNWLGRTAYVSGTGKTMLVKAVANSTTASFIRVVGSEFVQKYLGEVC